jgi:hypothetical protein
MDAYIHSPIRLHSVVLKYRDNFTFFSNEPRVKVVSKCNLQPKTPWRITVSREQGQPSLCGDRPRAGRLRFDSRHGQKTFFSVPQLSDLLWGPPSLVFNGYRGLSGWCVKLTTHLHLVPKSRIMELHPCSLTRLHVVMLN